MASEFEELPEDVEEVVGGEVDVGEDGEDEKMEKMEKMKENY